MDYDELHYLCAPSPTGVCNRRFDTPGIYYYTSGKVTNNAEPVAFSGKVIVLNLDERAETVAVLKKGKIPGVSKINYFLIFLKLCFLTCCLTWAGVWFTTYLYTRIWNWNPPITKEEFYLVRVLRWCHWSSHWKCSVKKVFRKISQNSSENICTRVTFLIELKKRLWHRCFLVIFCEISKSTFFTEHLRATASVTIKPFEAIAPFLYPLKI